MSVCICAMYNFFFNLLHFNLFCFYVLWSSTSHFLPFYSFLPVFPPLFYSSSHSFSYLTVPYITSSYLLHPWHHHLSTPSLSYMTIRLRGMEHCRNSLPTSSQNLDKEVERNGHVSLYDGQTDRYIVISTTFFCFLRIYSCCRVCSVAIKCGVEMWDCLLYWTFHILFCISCSHISQTP